MVFSLPENWEALSSANDASPTEIIIEGISNQALIINIASLSPNPFSRLNLSALQDTKGIKIGLIYREFEINGTSALIDASPLYLGGNLYLFSELGEYNLKALITYPIGEISYQIKGYTLPLESGNGGEFTGTIDWDSVTRKPSFFSGSYNDLANKPTIPTKLSELENDANFLTAIGEITWSQITGKPNFFSGSYNDLANKPTIPTKLSELENDANFLTINDLPTNSGGNIDFTLINSSSTLSGSGYYFTDNLASDIAIDCSNLEIGNHIIWHNLSNKAVFFSGANSIDEVSIPANKGLKIAANSSIQFFIVDSNKNIKKISGNHTIYWLPGVQPPDPFYDNILLLLKGDGENDSTAIVDTSPIPKAINIFGNTKISTNQKKYGNSSIYFDGVGDYLTIPSLALDNGGYSMTIESWVYPINNFNHGFFDLGPNVFNGFRHYDGKIAHQNGTGVATAIPANAWTHLAVTYSKVSGLVTVFRNGISIGSFTLGTDWRFINFLIGSINYGSGNYSFTGYLDSYRVTSAIRYTEDFNPEADTYLSE